MAKQEQPQRQSLSVGWEVGEVSAALEGVRRSLLFFRDEGQDLEEGERLQVLTEMAAGLSMLAGRLNLLVRCLDGRADPALILAEHNAHSWARGPQHRWRLPRGVAGWGQAQEGEPPMMDLRQIEDLADEAAAKAASEHRYPYTPFDEAEVQGYGVGRSFPFPNLGSFRPRGWVLVETLFCDSTGCGLESEPALTVRGFRESLRFINRARDRLNSMPTGRRPSPLNRLAV